MPETRYPAPGASVLLVSDAPAFTSRLNGAPEALIASTYVGNLSNSGETPTLLEAAGTPVKFFACRNRVPRPVDADGPGRSPHPGPGLIQPGPTAGMT